MRACSLFLGERDWKLGLEGALGCQGGELRGGLGAELSSGG